MGTAFQSVVINVDTPLEQNVPGYLRQSARNYTIVSYTCLPEGRFRYVYKIAPMSLLPEDEENNGKRPQQLYMSYLSATLGGPDMPGAGRQSVVLWPKDVFMQEVIGRKVMLKVSSSQKLYVNTRKEEKSFMNFFKNFADCDVFVDELSHKTTTFTLSGRNIKLWTDAFSIKTHGFYSKGRVVFSYDPESDCMRIALDIFKGLINVNFENNVEYSSEQLEKHSKVYTLSVNYVRQTL